MHNNTLSLNPSVRSKTKKTKLVGHDILIDSAMRNERNALLTLMSEVEVTGIVRNFDKYTISIELHNGHITCFYKHGIESFTIEKAE